MGEEDGQPLLPFVRVGEEVAGFAEAVMMNSLREAIHWIASGMQSGEVSVLFRVVLRCRFSCSVVDGELCGIRSFVSPSWPSRRKGKASEWSGSDCLGGRSLQLHAKLRSLHVCQMSAGSRWRLLAPPRYLRWEPMASHARA